VSIIVYVFGVQGGLIRDEDIVAFKALDLAYKINRESLCFVVNDLPPGPDRPQDYEGQTVALLKSLLKIDNPRIAFCDRLVPKNNPEGKARILGNLCEVIVKCVPKHHKKEKEIMLQADEIFNLKKEIKNQQNQFKNQFDQYKQDIDKIQKDYDELKKQPPKEFHHYEKEVVQSSRGCSIL